MSNLDKLNIYVPGDVLDAINKDAELFEIFKRDGRSINRNKFLSLVLLGYFDTYASEQSQLADAIATELDCKFLAKPDKNKLARRIARLSSPQIPSKQRGVNLRRLSLKPTAKTEGLIKTVLSGLDDDDTISRYFCSMLTSFYSKPSNERERIVFRDNVNLLQRACESKRQIAFTTIWDRERIYRVTPFKLAVGKDEQFNYLLCYEKASEERKALTVRLSRISHPCMLGEKVELPSEVRRHLIQMEKRGPQYAINDDEEACVRLTEEGATSYQRIYFGRPAYERIEHDENGDLYYFCCSKEQLFLYFKRFGFGEAEVIAPVSLRKRMIDFHFGALRMYGLRLP